MSSKGSLAIVLHAHLPFIRHPEQSWFLEEDWFFEAVTETYIPIILMIERLAQENIRPALTISLSPTLCAMLEDEMMDSRCRQYVASRLELIDQEILRLPPDSAAGRTAVMYRTLFEQALDVLDRYSGDLVTPFKQFQQNGLVEILTSSATHAVLPLLLHKESVSAQIKVAAEDYFERFSRKPKGMWLPECAFSPAITQPLQMAGFKYFFLEHHGLGNSVPFPRYGTYAPARVKGGVSAFARDSQSSREVWSSKFGYPGDAAYREFYRDVGFDADYDYIKPYLHEDGIRRSLGIKYHKITGNVGLAEKQPYEPELAAEKAKMHAADFLKKRMEQVQQVNSATGIRPVIVGTYDAELFGHWWFEGPQFLENMIRLIRQERLPLQMATASECLETSAAPEEIEPDASSWGEGGFFEPWVNATNDWIYPRINGAAEKMIALATKFQYRDSSVLERRALNQAARETLLSQSSDWAFLMYIGSHSEYAEKRVMEHCGNVAKLADMISAGKIDETFLKQLEAEHNLFPVIDFRVFASASVI